MSTYLQLFQDAKRECRITGTAPTSVTGNSGVLDRLANWIIDAYVEIQNRTEWRWMRHTFTCSVSQSDGTYAYTDCTDSETSSAISRFSHWWLNDPIDPPKIYLTASGTSAEYWLSWTPYEYFKTIYEIGTGRTSESNPAHVSVDHLNRIRLGPVPNDAYTLTGDYQLSAQVLASDGDTPEMPSQYHMLIVYMAMQKYGYLEGAQEVLMRGQEEGNKMMRQLEANQKPMPRLGKPLV